DLAADPCGSRVENLIETQEAGRVELAGPNIVTLHRVPLFKPTIREACRSFPDYPQYRSDATIKQRTAATRAAGSNDAELSGANPSADGWTDRQRRSIRTAAA